MIFHLTSHPKVQLLHNDTVLEVWIPPEVKTDPIAKFIILERLNLKETRQKCPKFAAQAHNQSHTLFRPTLLTSRSVM